jgi:hypothetical protein
MPRGVLSKVGDETVNANGYTQVKTEEGWRGKHTVILETKLGRKLKPGESARFADGDKSNLNPDNIILVEHRNARSINARIAKLEAEIADRQAVLVELRAQLEQTTS